MIERKQRAPKTARPKSPTGKQGPPIWKATQSARDELTLCTTPDQIAEAQRQGREWKPTQ